MFSSPSTHKEFEKLILSTHEIGPTGRNFTHKISPEALNKLIFEPKNVQFSWQTQVPTKINFDLIKESEQSYLVQTHAKIELKCPCVKCLKYVNFSRVLDFFMRMIKQEKTQDTPDFGEINCFFDLSKPDLEHDTQIEVGYFSQNRIDLGTILREQIYGCVPDYPQCRDPDSCLLAPEKTTSSKKDEAGPLAHLLKPYWDKKFGE